MPNGFAGKLDSWKTTATNLPVVLQLVICIADMKRLRQHIDIALLCLALCAPVGTLTYSAAMLSGCATGKGQLNPATGVYDASVRADAVVVTAQNIRESALGIFAAFMRTEKTNEAVLKALNPKIHVAAEEIRRNGNGYLDALTLAIKQYQSARTPENASKLNSAIAAVRSLLMSATERLAEASTLKAP